MEYATLTQIIHTGEPKKLLDKLNNVLNEVDEELGDLEKLSKLKKKARR